MTSAAIPRHQYIDRATGDVCDERLFGDRVVRALYSSAREHAPALFRALTSRRASSLLAAVNYDMPLGGRLGGGIQFLLDLGVDLNECLDPPASLDTTRKVFERRIRYWDCRPMPGEPGAIVSPADARVLVGSMSEAGHLFIKEKFFSLEELLARERWTWVFRDGDFALFRLTPEKYHYNHAPVSGRVVDYYAIDGGYHACNPAAIVALATPFSKNRREVTIIDTDVPGGTGMGLVAMIEVVALMIGRIEQCYSDARYENPRPVAPGMFLRRGQPKSVFRPGSSTVVLLFEPRRARFAEDLLRNQQAMNVASRLCLGFGRPLVETDVNARSWLARAMATRWE